MKSEMDLYEWAKSDSVLGPCTCRAEMVMNREEKKPCADETAQSDRASRGFFTQRFRAGLSCAAPTALARGGGRVWVLRDYPEVGYDAEA